MQTLTLAVDASCDLPKALYQRLEISTLPLAWLATPDELAPDDRSDTSTALWYQTAGAEPDYTINNVPTDTRLGQYLDENWLLTSDATLLITPARHRHPGYDHWHKQAALLQPQLGGVRHSASLPGHYRLRVTDSGHTLAAYGLLVQKMAMLHRNEGYSIDKLRLPLVAFSARITHLFSVPALSGPGNYTLSFAFPGLSWLRRSIMHTRKQVPFFASRNGIERLTGATRADVSISAIVDRCCMALEKDRLTHRTVNASFAGPIGQLHHHPAVKRLHQQVTGQGGHLWVSQMAGSSARILGRQAFSVAFVN